MRIPRYQVDSGVPWGMTTMSAPGECSPTPRVTVRSFTSVPSGFRIGSSTSDSVMIVFADR